MSTTWSGNTPAEPKPARELRKCASCGRRRWRDKTSKLCRHCDDPPLPPPTDPDLAGWIHTLHGARGGAT